MRIKLLAQKIARANFFYLDFFFFKNSDQTTIRTRRQFVPEKIVTKRQFVPEDSSYQKNEENAVK